MPANSNPLKRIEDARALFGRVRQGQYEKLGEFYDRYIIEVEVHPINFVHRAGMLV